MARSKARRKGKSKFVMIESFIFRSAAWQALSPHEVAAYIALKIRYDGLNNGRIGLGCRELADALHSSKDTARRALDTLVSKGFVEKAKASGFNVKSRVATEWRLTEYGCDVTGELPTKAFMKWRAEENIQAHQEDTQAHLKDTDTPNGAKNHRHRRITGTVPPQSMAAQAHQKDTYNIPHRGNTDAA